MGSEINTALNTMGKICPLSIPIAQNKRLQYLERCLLAFMCYSRSLHKLRYKVHTNILSEIPLYYTA